MIKVLFSATTNAIVAAVMLLSTVDVNTPTGLEKLSNQVDAIAELIVQLDDIPLQASEDQVQIVSSKDQVPLVIDPVMALTDAHTCMQLNLYHEARGESLAGIQAVRAVTLARVASGDFPNNICDVVWQRNQFEWTQNGRINNEILDLKGWNRVNRVLSEPMPQWDAAVTYYHSGAKPQWFRRANLVERKRIGNHIFYQE